MFASTFHGAAILSIPTVLQQCLPPASNSSESEPHSNRTLSVPTINHGTIDHLAQLFPQQSTRVFKVHHHPEALAPT